MQGISWWIVTRVAACDFKLTWKERSVVIWMFFMPLAFIVVMGMMFRGSSPSAPRAKLTVENHDTGFLSRELLEALQKEEIALVDSLREDESAVRTIVIPEDFTENILSRKRVTVLLRKEGGSNIEAGEVASVAIIRSLVRMISGLIELEAGALDQNVEGLKIEGDSLSGSLWELVRLRPGAIDSLHVELDKLQSRERLITVAPSMAGKATEIPRGFQSSVPGNLVMFVLMTMVFSGTGIAAERAGGILKRLGMTPAGKGDVVLGKLLSRMMIAGIQILFLLAVGRIAFRISLGNSPIALFLLMSAFAFCTGAFGVFFGSLFKHPDQVSGFAIITTLAMAALGGCWWPLEVVNRTFRIVALCLPTGWAISGLHKIVSFGYGLAEVIPHISILALFGLVFVLIASKKLKWSA